MFCTSYYYHCCDLKEKEWMHGKYISFAMYMHCKHDHESFPFHMIIAACSAMINQQALYINSLFISLMNLSHYQLQLCVLKKV